MAKKAASRKQAAEQQLLPALSVPVEFGGVSIGDGTARLGLKIDRTNLNIDAADEALCGRRLKGRVVILKDGENVNQTTFLDGVRHEVSSIFDVKRFGVAPRNITCGLTFSLADIDVEALSHFAKQKGRFIVDEVSAIPDEDEDEEVEEEEDEE
jgi:hypothetical protein